MISKLLTDLAPRWVVLEDGGENLGLSFNCPHCGEQRLAVLFHHRGHEAVDDAHIHARSPSTNNIWTMDGSDFTNLSLTPSVDTSGAGHWHGFIKNGEIA